MSAFLNVRDIEKSVEAYRALGFRVDARHETRDGNLGWADLSLDGAEIGLGAIRTNEDPEFRAWVSTPLGAGVVVYVDVPDVNAVWRKAKASSFEIEQPIESRSYGRVFMVNDPDGYTIAFIGAAPAKAAKPERAAKVAKPAKPAKAAPKSTSARGAKKPKAAAKR